MTTRLPDPRGSRAVLIGTSRYDSDLPDLLAVRNNLEVLQELLTSDSGGFPRERCEVVQDAPDPRAVCATIREAAMTATDTLLVYFSGHGVLNDDLTLHLALTGTDESDLRWTSIPFEAIREILEASPCPNKILILDCCNSGRVLDTLMGNGPEPSATLTIRGTYILTSSANAPSYAPVGERYTAFTGEFIRHLRDGLPGGPDLLTLSALYDPLTKSLTRRGYPQPRQQSSDGHARLGLVRNRGAGSPVEDVTGPEEEGTPDVRPPSGEIRFAPSLVFHRLRNWGIGLPFSLGLLLVGVPLLPAKGKDIDLTDWRHWAGVLALLGIVLVLAALGKRNPGGYSLVLSADGVEVQYGESEHFSYPWHRVSRAWIRQRPPSRLRGPRYDLMVRPMPGVYAQTASRRTPGPHQDDAEGTLRFADLRRLRTTPEAVEAALAVYAGAAWTPSADLAADPARAPQAERVFTADRRLLAVVAVAGAVLGWDAVPLHVLVRPAEILSTPMPLVTCALCFGTAWFAGSRAVRPVRLRVGAAGLLLTRGELEIAYAWSEIEHIGIVNWPRGARYFGLLVIRPVGSPEGRIDRTSMLLPKLAPGALTLCALPEITHDRSRLEAALARFADESQLALPGEAWLRVPPGRSAPPRAGLTFRGRQPAGVSALVGAALFAPFALTGQVADLDRAPDWLPVLGDLLAFLFVFGFCAYFLTGRHHVHVHVRPAGLTLKAFGSHQLHIPWGDVDRIGIVVRADPEQYALVLWPRHGATIPRALWLPTQKTHGGLRLLTLEDYRIEISPEALDQAIARYAGRRHTHMAQLRQSARKKN
ncbi:caspase, EACC1-associated type [Streptomyces sp. SP18BB07]|uniref:caspase, EACC1-associated type n=1 Tax=Streptomyces sp. SP18BB07 TaxID=3002522 RepID=UPI002E7771FB|nr:caspase family protein [Streptomyces sp. SP18BB07]MEE1758070.1 caspase family protein [Streptomyces sp. SP18BB07]